MSSHGSTDNARWKKSLAAGNSQDVRRRIGRFGYWRRRLVNLDSVEDEQYKAMVAHVPGNAVLVLLGMVFMIGGPVLHRL